MAGAPFNMERFLQLDSYLGAFEAPRNGIIYAGAHEGEHLPLFLSLGFENILAIEPNPEALERLRRLECARIRIAPIAVSDHDGECEYFEHALVPTLNSTLPPSEEVFVADFGADLFDRMRPVSRKIPCARLDTIVKTYAPGIVFDALHMNIQGGEANLVQGGTETLRGIHVIHTETNFAERYRGCFTHDRLTALLDEHGFDLMALEIPPTATLAQGDGTYVQRDIRKRFASQKLGRVKSRLLAKP
jgi:FkbM family methyltransferase